MSDFPLSQFVLGLGLSVLAVVALMTVTFAVATVQKRHSVIDVAWGLGFVLIAVVTFVASAGVGNEGRRVLMLVLVVAWGVRLAAFIGWRGRGGEEDPRYEEMLSDPAGSAVVLAVRKVYLPQAAVMLFVSLPVQVAMFSTGPLGVVAWVGAALWAVGLFFEAVGDQQLAAFRKDRSRRGTVLDTGLWRFTRHPNYFGDAMVWTGLFLVAADSWPGVLTVLSPALMFWALARKTGKPLTEQRMSSRPGYKEYVERTSGFFPLPPRTATSQNSDE